MKKSVSPIKDCKIVASKYHYQMQLDDFIGTVIKVDGDRVLFKNKKGETDELIWRFNNGYNVYVDFWV